MSSGAIHSSPFAGPSQPRKGEDIRVFAPTDSKECISCGKCWPWVVFNVERGHLPSVVCTRCARYDLEVERWKGLGTQMHQDLAKARHKFSKHRGEQSLSQPIPRDTQPRKQSASHQGGSNILYVIAQSQVGSSRSRGQKLLTEKELSIIDVNIPVLRTIAEPQRASIWIQLTYQPTSSQQDQVPQLDIYGSYTAFVGNRKASLDGPALIKLIIKTWADHGVQMRGSPEYTIAALRIRDSSSNSFHQAGKYSQNVTVPIDSGVSISKQIQPVNNSQYVSSSIPNPPHHPPISQITSHAQNALQTEDTSSLQSTHSPRPPQIHPPPESSVLAQPQQSQIQQSLHFANPPDDEVDELEDDVEHRDKEERASSEDQVGDMLL
ncbi:uncharacterized protein I206_106284 [Kwoniella pini CBS 10737]|uniref:RFX-type winged-helix domain-containing protein n=1 Tax=Kwoniella pini CBS 10737 TaxID=1296096 RepID=A0A1B9I1L7_9TREE|nr:uncharacterized protein I206_05110 [Kwoniella pini CBS 10737]OCF49417.1 hypothetical protein I206_05110 [Kwoniella pini CBS 10737]